MKTTYTIRKEFRAYIDDEFVDAEDIETFTDINKAITAAKELNRTQAHAWEALPGIWEYCVFTIEVDNGYLATIINYNDIAIGFTKPMRKDYIDKIEAIARWIITLLWDAERGDYKAEREEADSELMSIYKTAKADGVNVDDLKAYWKKRIACVAAKW